MNSLDQEKLFYERFWALHRSNDLIRVFKNYGPEAFRRSSVLEGFEQFIIKHEFRGGTCLEIGTLKGLTAIVMSRYFDRVISIDVIRDPLKYELVKLCGVRNVEFINVKDNAEKAAIVGLTLFDGAYIDGDHTHDTETDFALVSRCGNVLLHEHWDAQPAVMELINALPPNEVRTEGKFALWTR